MGPFKFTIGEYVDSSTLQPHVVQHFDLDFATDAFDAVVDAVRAFTQTEGNRMTRKDYNDRFDAYFRDPTAPTSFAIARAADGTELRFISKGL